LAVIKLGGETMTRHGELYLRDQVPPRSIFHEKGRFGRLFPSLPPFATDTPQVRERLSELGKTGGLMDALSNNPDNTKITAGFTFFGQFLDHDMTFDPTSSLERQNDPESIQNFRTPLLELDNVYGSGPAASPHLYDKTTGNLKLLIEKLDDQDPSSKDDLPRNSQKTAIIADPRNDENVIVSQLQLAFLKFHNKVVDLVLEGGTDRNEAFKEAQRLVRWHYQWIILHEFLPLTVGQPLVDDILNNKRKFYTWRNEPFIPVEFSVAAYRFGHSQVRPGYLVNNGTPPFRAGLFNSPDTPDPNPEDPSDLRGGVRAKRRFVDWDLFFDFGNEKAQSSKKIDSKLSSPLLNLPFGPGLPGLGQPTRSLAARNLLRHLTFSLPSGQDVAKAMGIEPLSVSDLSELKDLGFENQTPLWFYLLKESDIKAQGEKLGPTAGRIVAEVFIGLLQGDYESFLYQNPMWKPTLGKDGDFKIVDLLKLAGVAPEETV
jgi:hypothetical protein